MIYSLKRDKQTISICQPVEQSCLNCNVPEDCLPLALAKGHIIQLNKLLKNLLTSKPKVPVLKQGEPFSNFYIVKSGGLKASLIEANGQERILEFHVPGEIVSNRLKRDRKRDFFNLPMSRQDIGNHLGLATETISRIFTRWQKNGAILVNNRLIKLDVTSLQAVLYR